MKLNQKNIGRHIYDLLREFQKLFPNYNLYFCLGTDLINRVSQCASGDKLFDLQ